MSIYFLALAIQQDTIAASISLEGKVLDAQTLKPVAGAIIYIDSAKATTSSDGTYEIKIGRTGFVTVRVEADRYRTHTESFEIPAEGTYRKNFYLVRKETKLIVVVLDDYSENPLKALVKIGGKSYSTDESGMVEVKLPEGVYDIVIIPRDKSHQKKEIRADVSGRLKVLKITLIPTRINLGDLRFETGKYEIKEHMLPKLERACDILKRYPQARVVVEGHTDTRGSAAYNLRLSKKRAEAVKDWLIQHQCIRPENIEARGYGESKPIVFPEKKPEDYAKNRRVVLRILMPG